jgi:hypothetical protein
VLTRAGEYALQYESRFSLLVAEEDYYQRADSTDEDIEKPPPGKKPPGR